MENKTTWPVIINRFREEGFRRQLIRVVLDGHGLTTRYQIKRAALLSDVGEWELMLNVEGTEIVMRTTIDRHHIRVTGVKVVFKDGDSEVVELAPVQCTETLSMEFELKIAF